MKKEPIHSGPYTLAEAAHYIGMPPHLLKNWVIGRPYKMRLQTPAVGIRSRPLFTRHELAVLEHAYQVFKSCQTMLNGTIPTILEDSIWHLMREGEEERAAIKEG